MASRKQFLGFACGLTSRFVSRNNDVDGYWGVGVLAKRLHDAGRGFIEFDLLSDSGTRADDSTAWLRHQMLMTETPAEWLSGATLRVEYTPRARDASKHLWPAWLAKHSGVPMFRVVATATLIDDHGRSRAASSVTWCWDHDPWRERQSARAGRGQSGTARPRPSPL
jgi:hypothetical protein